MIIVLNNLARFDGLGIPPLHEDIEPEERSGLQLDIEDDEEDRSAPAPPVPAQIVQRDTEAAPTIADALLQDLTQPVTSCRRRSRSQEGAT